MIDFSRFIDIHKGAKAIILGLGTSTNDVIREDLSGIITIGVNDIGAVYTPKYLLTLDTPSRLDQSMGGRIKRATTVANTNSDYLFTLDYIKEWEAVESLNGRVVGMKLGGRRLANIDDATVFDFSSNSPYVAAILAFRMGCTKVGLAGVDFTDHHCHVNDGMHELVRNGRLQEIDLDYSNLVVALSKRGCELYNLSEISMLTSIPKINVREFLDK